MIFNLIILIVELGVMASQLKILSMHKQISCYDFKVNDKLIISN